MEHIGLYDTIKRHETVRSIFTVGRSELRYPLFEEDGVIYYGYWQAVSSNGYQVQTAKRIAVGWMIDGESVGHGDYDTIEYVLDDTDSPDFFFADLDDFDF